MAIRKLHFEPQSSFAPIEEIRLEEKNMNKILVALSLAAFALTSTAPAYAADKKAEMKECTPVKKDYHQNAKGKCVKDAKMKKMK